MRLALAYLLFAIGIGLAIWKEKRRFARTNAAGVEQFESFRGMALARTIERIAGWLTIVCIVAASLLLL